MAMAASPEFHQMTYKIRYSIAILCFLFFVTAPFLGCAIVSVKAHKIANIDRAPDYEETLPYYFFGLVGKPHLDVRKICFGNKVEYIRNIYTPEDISINVKTLFIYTPKTVRIWCGPN